MTLDFWSAEIAARERRLATMEAPTIGTLGALAHARKEWGHAANVEDPDARFFHFRVVERDLAAFDRCLAEAGTGGDR